MAIPDCTREQRATSLDQAERPVDGEIVHRSGIHPFYLRMTLDEVFLAASGWTVRKAEKDTHLDSFNLELAKSNAVIDVSAINIKEINGGDKLYLIYYLHTDSGRLQKGIPIRSKTDSELIEYFDLVPDTQTVDDESGDLLYLDYKSRDGYMNLFADEDCVSVSLSVNLFEASG